MKAIAPELVIILVGLVLLTVGLCYWFGFAVALTVDGVLLVGLGASSAAQGARSR